MGAYIDVALAMRAYLAAHQDASILVFDDRTGKEIDFDLRGSEADVVARLEKHFAGVEQRTPGRPKLGVIAREVTLLPRHWEWLAAQNGGASATLRRLVDDARRAELGDKAQLRKLQERTYRFMSALAGNRENFEEASRALFANDLAEVKRLTSAWPPDVRNHLFKLFTDEV